MKMVKVITYGTYDLLHYGHIRLLERAKALGDFLIVGVTADDFDKTRGKINVQQSLMERVEAVRATGIADEIIIEEYEGQKIDDIKKYDIDIFTVGSDWKGKFDYLKEFCKVVYLERTKGISSSDLRNQKRFIKLGLVGNALFLNKVLKESKFVNGLQINAAYTKRQEVIKQIEHCTDNMESLLEKVDAVYIRSLPKEHYKNIKTAINYGKHILCESPISLDKDQTKELFSLARDKKIILMEGIKTAYATAFTRLLLLAKSGVIGEIKYIDVTCTSLAEINSDWNAIHEWGPTALLPIFQLLGTEIKDYRSTLYSRENNKYFLKMDFWFSKAVGSIKIGNGIKSEGVLVISGTQGYIYVPSPWWKTDYFEIRYEDQSQNKRYFYQLDGEGIRYELVAFARSIERGCINSNISQDVSCLISDIMHSIDQRKNLIQI